LKSWHGIGLIYGVRELVNGIPHTPSGWLDFQWQYR
jgi:hypothetical protein